MTTTILLIVAVYLALGVIFAAWFVFAGLKRIDPVAAQGTLGFRLLIFPASVALWPVLMKRLHHWRRKRGLQVVSHPHRHRAAHRWVWVALAAALLVLLYGALG